MKTDNALITIVIVILALFLILGLFGGMIGYSNYGMGGMMQWMYPGLGFMPFFGWLFMILIVIALVLFIAWLVKQLQHPQETRRKR